MRKYIYLILIISLTFTVNAQEKIINVEFGVGPSFAMGDLNDWAEGGFNGYANVLYNLNNRLSAGLEYNILLFKALPDYSSRFEFSKVDAILLRSKYFIADTKVRPYGAIMTGIYINTFQYPTGYDGDTWSEDIYTTNLGAGFEFGVKFYNCNVGLGYHYLGEIEEVFNNWGDVEYVKGKISFFQLKLGFDFSLFSKK